MSAASFREVLRAARETARLSQLELSLRADVSQRHISFLESGKASAGRDVVLRLAQALALPPHGANALLAAAGFAPVFPQRTWSDTEMAPLRAAARHVLKGHLPFPAVLIDEAGDILAENSAFPAVLSLLGDVARMWRATHGDKPHNLLRLATHPKGLARAMTNFPDVTRATLQRALTEAPHAPRLRAIIDEIAAYPNIDPEWLAPNWGPPPAPIIEERYKVGRLRLNLFAVVTTLGAPMDLAGAGLRIEAFYPADEATEAILKGLPTAPRPHAASARKSRKL